MHTLFMSAHTHMRHTGECCGISNFALCGLLCLTYLDNGPVDDAAMYSFAQLCINICALVTRLLDSVVIAYLLASRRHLTRGLCSS